LLQRVCDPGASSKEAIVLHSRFVAPPLVLALIVTAGSVASASSLPTVSTTATLTVLVPTVDHVGAGATARRPARDGMNLEEGDRVVTGVHGSALITFLDGSTVTVEPGSEVVVRRADVHGQAGASIRLLIHAGKVWARIANLVNRRSSISLESSEYAATARDGLIGAERRADGGFVCWTRAGALALTDRFGATLATVDPGHKATVASGRRPTVQAFSVHESTLGVTASSGVLPLVLMPSGRHAAGFVEPGIEVNQVFGSLTAGDHGRTIVDVPAGVRGPYVLLLEGVTGGPFTVEVVGRFRGDAVYRRELRGTLAPGQRVATRIEPYLEDEANDPRIARLFHARLSRLAEWTAPLPVRALVSPREQDARLGAR
jgi:hypothetical protein